MGGKCPICELDADIERRRGRDAFEIKCGRCGQFVIISTLMSLLRKENLINEDLSLLPYLSAHTRQATERGIQVELNSANWRIFAQAHTTTLVSQKVMKLLELVASRSAHPGALAPFDVNLDYPLVDAASVEEVGFVLRHLLHLGYLAAGPIYDPPAYSVTVKGWERLEPPVGGGIPGRCFVAMSFHESLKDAYLLGIEPALRDCGFEPIRVDLVHHNEKICDKILAEIRLAEFMVADFTLQRAGVYFEAGFAMGLGRPVIWMCREDDFDNTHFDTRQYNHILWSTPAELKEKLIDRIRATIATSTNASSLPQVRDG